MKILSFMPHSGLWNLKFPRSIILESLKKNGHEIHEIRCREAFNNYCLVMMSQVPHKNSILFSEKEKKNICNDCMHKSNILSKEFKFIDLDINKISKDKVDLINHEISKINQYNFLDYKYKSINIGRYCMSEIILMTKKKSLILNNNEWNDYLHSIKNSIITIDFLDKLFKQDNYDVVLTNNGFYSYMKATKEIAEKYKINVLDINQNRNFQKQFNSFHISKKNDVFAYRTILKKWSELKKLPLNKNQMRSTTNHMNLLISGKTKNEYIDNKRRLNFDIRKFFKIEKEKKIILVCTSSQDEILSYEFMNERVSERKLLFNTQLEWINSIIEFAKKNNDLHFIIRIHPREDINYSHSKSSEMYEQLLEITKDKPKNISLNLPNQKISIYEVIENVDLVLNSWSSVGKDLALLGLPVITYGIRHLFYPEDLNIPLISNRIDDYFTLIRKSINSGWDHKRIIKAYRWSHLEFDHSTLDIADATGISNLKKTNKKFFLKIVDFLRTLINKDYHLTKHISKRPKFLKEEKFINSVITKNQSIFLMKNQKDYFKTSETEELKFIKNEIKEILNNLYDRNYNDSNGNGLRSKLKSFVNI